MKVRDVMTVDVATATLRTTLDQMATLMKKEDTGVIPVLDEDGQLMGVVTDRDIVVRCVAAGMDPAATTAEDVLSEDLQTVQPETDLSRALALMAKKQIRRLPVLENGELVGVLSIGDIAVKSDRDRETGETLDMVSKGVKASPKRQTGARKQPQSADQGRQAKRGSNARRQSGNSGGQGIANRRPKGEKGRQQPVVPIRSEGARQKRATRRGGSRRAG
jgi:CBS domain-containing protein